MSNIQDIFTFRNKSKHDNDMCNVNVDVKNKIKKRAHPILLSAFVFFVLFHCCSASNRKLFIG